MDTDADKIDDIQNKVYFVCITRNMRTWLPHRYGKHSSYFHSQSGIYINKSSFHRFSDHRKPIFIHLRLAVNGRRHLLPWFNNSMVQKSSKCTIQ